MAAANRQDIEALRHSFQCLRDSEQDAAVILVKGMQYLFWCAEQFQEKCYLESGLLLLHVYMEEGFAYEAHGQLFDRLLDSLGTCRQEEFPRLCLQEGKFFPKKRKE